MLTWVYCLVSRFLVVCFEFGACVRLVAYTYLIVVCLVGRLLG